MKNNLVSIIMPAYNAEKYIGEAIESVIAQTYKDWELVIVDDCSKDKTAEIAQSYVTKDSRIKLYKLKQNKGVANARNVAMEKAQGQYIVFLDSDDMWLPEKLAKQIEFMRENGYVFTYHDFRTFNINNDTLGKILHVPKQVDYNEFLKGNNTGSCLTTIIDRKVIDKIYMPDKKHEDYICWLDIFKQYKVTGYGLNECLGYYRIGKESRSSNKLKSALWTWKVYRESQELGVFSALKYMVFYIFNAIKKRS